MPKFRPRLRTLRESNHPTKTQKKKGKHSNKLQNIQLRYSHIPIEKYNKNTLYTPTPRPNLKKSKKYPHYTLG